MNGLMFPSVLVLLLLLPFVAMFFVWRWRVRAALLYSLGDAEQLAGLVNTIRYSRRVVKLALWFVAVGALIFALSRPLWGFEAAIIETRGISVMVVLDVSASMDAQDVNPSRLEQAKFAVRDLFTALAGNELGLVLFAGQAIIQFPLTTETGAAESFLNAVSTRSMTRQGTVIDAAIRSAVRGFEVGRSGTQVIILVSDGEDFEGDPLRAADEAREQGITIYALGVGGTGEGAPIPVYDANGQIAGYKSEADGNLALSRLNEVVLQQVVERAGGRYWHLDGGGDSVRALVNEVGDLEDGLLGSQAERRGIERFGIFVALSLLALSVEMLLPETTFNEVV